MTMTNLGVFFGASSCLFCFLVHSILLANETVVTPSTKDKCFEADSAMQTFLSRFIQTIAARNSITIGETVAPIVAENDQCLYVYICPIVSARLGALGLVRSLPVFTMFLACRVEECTSGNLINVATRWWFEKNFGDVGKTCDVAIFNGGALFESIPIGNISYSDITRMTPYPDNVVYFVVPGPILIQVSLSNFVEFQSSNGHVCHRWCRTII
jgi:2',3'-cyclic-nucleotide 2'-phosphodiesterase (5'-nucleotidase family)